MKIALIGLSNSGKTTIFNALTRSEAEVSPFGGSRVEPNLAAVGVEDDRVDRLSAMYQPKRITFASVEFMDFSGPVGEGEGQTPFSGEATGLLRTADALALVLRNFSNDLSGEAAPTNDMKQVEEELLLADLMVVEKRLEKIAWAAKRGLKNATLQLEESVLKKIEAELNENRPVRDLDLSTDELRTIQGFRFLTAKPVVVVLNSDEGAFGQHEALLSSIGSSYPAVEFAGTFEMELSRLSDEEDIKMFMEDLGIQTSARSRLTRLAYHTLGYLSFFTVGSDEVRAWNLRRGSTAIEAAGSIHTDLSRGFIRAECFTYDDLVTHGSEKAVKEQGRFRLESKQYVVQDGDILGIRFSV